MSTISDVFAALKKVMLLQEDVARLQRNVEAMASDVRRTRDYADGIDRRVVRLETLVEVAAAQRGRDVPRIEG
ncbi:hypothetical protein [Sphingomonas aerophila]|jgi:hypothetical protein|uniref:Uncharacterized protein n=1 Tax=Sphingomonas aerophila TaxID=1344948 RepID=A0A7W9BF60_9SPHN|nr:hypothetical protein [Sphingomonas aerophila]MBB5716058.1 hypothetical protein [Sphingomonas aerophila]